MRQPRHDYPIIVIGAGAGGLVVAIGAAKAGKKVLLIEKGNYGGDCTNFGCIPSKSIIAAAHTAHQIHHASAYGITTSSSFEAEGALKRAQQIVAQIRSHEDPEALKKLGVETLTGTASFEDPQTLKVLLKDGSTQHVSGKQFVIATGSFPFIPPIKGLANTPFLTNETIFHLETIPKKLGIIGGGPIGSELAQAFQRLGSQVFLIQRGKHILKKEDPEVQKRMEQQFTQEGISLYLDCEPIEIQKKENNISIKMRHQEKEKEIEITHLLVSSGRRPHLKELNLEAIRVVTTPKGIVVDRYGRTSQKHIFAVGDVAGRAIFTHVAENEARTILTNLLIPWPLKKKIDRSQAIPRVTYTDPEVASIGLSETEAIKQYGQKKIATYHVPFSEIDRAITTGRTEGFVTVVTKKWSSRILGATIVSPRAGEMLLEISIAMSHNIPLRKLAALIHPYPTYSLAIRKAADQWLTKTLLPFLLKWTKR